MRPIKGKEKALKYYSQTTETKDYVKMYEKGYSKYPANLIRLNIILKRLRKFKINSILDVGCGSCGPMKKLLQEGYKVQGIDFSEKMIEEGGKVLEKSGFSSKLISIGDLEKDSSLPNKKFDSVIALGVFPHILNEKKALSNIRKRLKKGGKAFIEFRNDLFAVYTLNQYSVDFFLNRVVLKKILPKKILRELEEFYSIRFRTHKQIRKDYGKISYDEVLAKFHNPLNIGSELFFPNKFSIDNIHFYHYHALPPIFQSRYPKLFNELSLKLEKPNDWRGYLMASAFVVEATY